MNCGHSDVLGKIDLKSVKRRPARGVLGGAESVNYGENVDGKQPDYVNDNPVDILAILQRNLSRLRPLARKAT